MTFIKIIIIIGISFLGLIFISYIKDKLYPKPKSKIKYFKERENERDSWFG